MVKYSPKGNADLALIKLASLIHKQVREISLWLLLQDGGGGGGSDCYCEGSARPHLATCDANFTYPLQDRVPGSLEGIYSDDESRGQACLQ